MSFMLFRVRFMFVMLGALKCIALKTAEHHKFLCVCFMSGWVVVSGLGLGGAVPNQ